LVSPASVESGPEAWYKESEATFKAAPPTPAYEQGHRTHFAFAANASPDFATDMAASLFPVTEWVLNFAVYFLKTISSYTPFEPIVSQATFSPICRRYCSYRYRTNHPLIFFSFAVIDSADAFFSVYSPFIANRVPGLAFLFDLELIGQLREAVFLSHLLRDHINTKKISTPVQLHFRGIVSAC
jgi:hypothetical protein